MTVRRAATATVAMMTMVALAACTPGGGGGQADPGPPLTVWVDANRAVELQQVAEQFEEETGVVVELVQKEYGDGLRDDFITQAPTGRGPDVIVGGHDWLGQFVQNGVVAPLELGDRASEFVEVGLDAMTFDGVLYGLPASLENIALVRNTALASSTPTDWQGLLAEGQRLVDEGLAEYPVLLQSGPESDPYHLYPVQASFGASLFGIDETGSYDPDELLIGGEAGDRFAEALAEWGRAGVINVNISGDIAREEFVAGKSPWMVTGPWTIPAIEQAGIEYAIESIPSAGGEAATPFVGVQGFFVSSQSQNPLAANSFVVDYLGSEEVQLGLYELGGRAPALLSAFEVASADPVIRAFGEVGAAGVPMPNIPQMGAVWNHWGVTQAAIITGAAVDPVAAWREMTSRIAADIGG